ncbi:adenosylcobinamide-GDP ribazoletransferase [Afifella pfennigii]|uniref:adenosylcobinamide-GDP ribazoletransferase n=1 Tax=Afifella pfennigii TaxID=209897 RepID=UPI00068A0A3D|nr:adenosylcobinamide-GDP ribazoletransferase [Afifella pfennigii]
MSDLAEHFRRLPADARACLAFYSRLPISPPLVEPGTEPRSLADSAAAWPLAGALIALTPAVLLSFLVASGASPLIAALLALALYTALGGALHEDGFADTADGFGGGASTQERLDIMRDSRIGTYGVLALLFAIAIRVAGLAETSFDAATGAFALLCVAAIARAGAIVHWSALTHARADGVGRWAGRPDRSVLTAAMLTAVPAALLLIILFGVAALIGLLLAAGGILLFNRLAQRLIGGHTGDTLGAAVILAEALLFAGLAFSG